MRKKLIEIYQQDLIVCDNTSCDYKIISKTGDPNEDISMYINKPCPQCGENLLTENDYQQNLKVLKTVNWINKWFSWLTFFVSKKSKKHKMSVHVHNGVNIKN